MDIVSLLKIGAAAIQNNDDDATTGLDTNQLISALGSLLGGGSEGSIDLGGLVSKFTQGGLGDIVSSWLGDGENQPVSADKIKDLLGEERIAEFSSKLGIGEESGARGLADALPSILDNASKGGSLLDNLIGSMGGAKGVMDVAKNLF